VAIDHSRAPLDWFEPIVALPIQDIQEFDEQRDVSWLTRWVRAAKGTRAGMLAA
jgi:hypothetical protein